MVHSPWSPAARAGNVEVARLPRRRCGRGARTAAAGASPQAQGAGAGGGVHERRQLTRAHKSLQCNSASARRVCSTLQCPRAPPAARRAACRPNATVRRRRPLRARPWHAHASRVDGAGRPPGGGQMIQQRPRSSSRALMSPHEPRPRGPRAHTRCQRRVVPSRERLSAPLEAFGRAIPVQRKRGPRRPSSIACGGDGAQHAQRRHGARRCLRH